VSADRLADDPGIRALAADDVDAVAAIERAIYPNPWRRDDFAELVDAPGALAWVAEDTSVGIVGYAVAWIAADEAELANLAVAAGWQRQGIGARLVDVACRTAHRRGARTMWLDVRVSNAAARSLYSRRGFRVVGVRRGYYARPREDALVMALDLSESPHVVDPAPGAG
jgi:ribosomal-protein-alanine N-acetyltransferase